MTWNVSWTAAGPLCFDGRFRTVNATARPAASNTTHDARRILVFINCEQRRAVARPLDPLPFHSSPTAASISQPPDTATVRLYVVPPRTRGGSDSDCPPEGGTTYPARLC